MEHYVPAPCAARDLLLERYAGRHLRKCHGGEMKVSAIANIHHRQLFMNIKEHLRAAVLLGIEAKGEKQPHSHFQHTGHAFSQSWAANK